MTMNSIADYNRLQQGFLEPLTKPSMKPLQTPNDEDEDEAEPNAGVFFWINKNGFPINEETWERMWDHAIKRHPQGNNVIANMRKSIFNLPDIPIPVWTMKPQMSLEKKILTVQKYIESFSYNYTGTQFFDIKKNRPLCGLMDTAREIIQESLPIKCLEAVILAIYLTNGFRKVERFAISFNSVSQDVIHRHVVLGIYCNGLYGALGLSRRKELMYKPLTFQTLFELIENFQNSYERYHHKLLKVRIGLPVNHNSCSIDGITWRALEVNINKLDCAETEKRIEKHSRFIRQSILCKKSNHPARSARVIRLEKKFQYYRINRGPTKIKPLWQNDPRRIQAFQATLADLQQNSVSLSRAITFPPLLNQRRRKKF